MTWTGDRFDNDCMVGTQFDSSQPHHAVLRKQRFTSSTERRTGRHERREKTVVANPPKRNSSTRALTTGLPGAELGGLSRSAILLYRAVALQREARQL